MTEPDGDVTRERGSPGAAISDVVVEAAGFLASWSALAKWRRGRRQALGARGVDVCTTACHVLRRKHHDDDLA
jgi:hypothetical protein